MSRKSKNTAICRRAKTLHRTIIAVARAMSKTIAASKPPTAYPATGGNKRRQMTTAHLKFLQKSPQVIVPEAIFSFPELIGVYAARFHVGYCAFYRVEVIAVGHAVPRFAAIEYLDRGKALF